MASSVTRRLKLRSWLHRTVVAVALLAIASGFAQFAVTASLRDVATAFGADTAGSIAEQTGLATSTVGLGLGVIRLASLGALPLSSVADRFGRRRVMLSCTAIGLGLTAAAALSPSFWWFVAIVALGRPMLSATNAVGSVVASEETTSEHRTKAIALAVAGYALGAGIVSTVRVPINSMLGFGFRGLFACALLFVACLPLISRLLTEPERFVRLREVRVRRRLPSLDRLRTSARDHRTRRSAATTPTVRDLMAVHPMLRRRLLILVALAFAFNFVTGPVNTLLFLYAEGELGISRASMAGAVVAVGPLGLLGLLVGRWAADRLGRRVGAIIPQLLLAASGVLAYSGSAFALIGGYWAGVVVQAAYGTAFGALSTELFPTSIRATAQGWLTAGGVVGAAIGLVLFGAISDATDSFVIAALAVCAPCAAVALGFLTLPETRGQELEESAPEIV